MIELEFPNKKKLQNLDLYENLIYVNGNNKKNYMKKKWQNNNKKYINGKI